MDRRAFMHHLHDLIGFFDDTLRLLRPGGRLTSQDQLRETRQGYADRESLLEDIARRRGRSILHQLSDTELDRLVQHLRLELPAGPIRDADRSSVWPLRPR